MITATTCAHLFDANNTPTVPAAFWEHFVSLSDDKTQPVVLEQDTLIEPLLSLEDAFDLARNVVESGDMTVNADGQMLKQPAVPNFPPDFDGFEQFVRDFAALNNADGITFTRDYCLKHSNTVTTKLRAFTHGYNERYGMPYPGANAVFIGGRYRSSWIGPHNDSCDTRGCRNRVQAPFQGYAARDILIPYQDFLGFTRAVASATSGSSGQ